MGVQVLLPKYHIRRMTAFSSSLLIFQSGRCGLWAARIPGGVCWMSSLARWPWLSRWKGWRSSFSSFPSSSSSCNVDCHFSGPGKATPFLATAGHVSVLSHTKVGGHPAHCSSGSLAGQCPCAGTEPSSAWPWLGNWGQRHSWHWGDFVPPLPRPRPGTCFPLRPSLEGALLPSLTKMGCYPPRCSGFSSFQTFIQGLRACSYRGPCFYSARALRGLVTSQTATVTGQRVWPNTSGNGGPEKCLDMGELRGPFLEPIPPATLLVQERLSLRHRDRLPTPLRSPWLQHPPHPIPRVAATWHLQQHSKSIKNPQVSRKKEKSTCYLQSEDPPHAPLQTNLNTAFLVLISGDIFSALTHCAPLPAIIWEFHHG